MVNFDSDARIGMSTSSGECMLPIFLYASIATISRNGVGLQLSTRKDESLIPKEATKNKYSFNPDSIPNL